MTLQASGAIAISDINVELGYASNRNSNLNESALRTLAGVPSGAISLSNFYGKSNFGSTWSGNSTYVTGGYTYGIVVSGGSWRTYQSYNNLYGAWITTYSNGTFSTTNSYPSGTHGIQASGNQARSVATWFSTTYYGAWLTFTIGPGWSGDSDSTYGNFGMDTSSGALRSNHAANYGSPYGAWITLT